MPGLGPWGNRPAMPTPFGIRRRIKRLLGLPVDAPTTAPEADAGPQITLIVVGPNGQEQSLDAPAGSTISGASMKLQRPISTGCPDSTCGTCHVEILEGGENVSPTDGRERATLKTQGMPDGQRLSCRATVTSGTVKVRAFELM